MSKSFRWSGKHISVATASGAITSGALVVQEGFFGVAIKSAITGASLELDTQGVHLIAVPASTVKGDRLYVAGSPATEDNAPALIRNTASSNTLVGRAVGDRDADGNGLVLLTPQL